MKTRTCLKYFVNDILWKQFSASNLSQTLSNFISLTIFVTLMSSHSFNAKFEQFSYKKMLKFALLANSFSDLFVEVEI